MTVLSIVKDETYQEIIENYLSNLTDEEKCSRVSSVVVLGVGENGGFYSVVKNMGVLETIGLIEQLKYYLIQESVYEDELGE